MERNAYIISNKKGVVIVGRKHYNERIAQHSRHAKQKQCFREGEAPERRAFGIRRKLNDQSSLRLRHYLRQLQIAGELPENLAIEPQFYVPLLPLEFMNRQAARGLLKHYDLLDMERRLRRESRGTDRTHIDDAEFKMVTVKWGHCVQVVVESPELTVDRMSIARSAGRYGLRGLARHNNQSVMSMYVGQLEQRTMPFEAREDLRSQLPLAIDEVHGIENPLVFGEWDIYPVAQQAV